MELGPFYTGQVPREPLTIIVRDAFTDRAVDLSGYETASAVIVNPNDEVISTDDDASEWSGEIANPVGGEVRIALETSPFSEVGDHELQVLLKGPGDVQDITSTVTFEVFERLGG